MGAASSKDEIYLCSRCGAVAAGPQRTCPQCGADSETGWHRCAQAFTVEAAGETGRHGFVSGFFRRLRMGLRRIPVGWSRLFRGAARRQNGPNARYQRLLQMARGNKALANRMVERERRRNPGADYDQLLADAIYRWEREFR